MISNRVIISSILFCMLIGVFGSGLCCLRSITLGKTIAHTSSGALSIHRYTITGLAVTLALLGGGLSIHYYQKQLEFQKEIKDIKEKLEVYLDSADLCYFDLDLQKKAMRLLLNNKSWLKVRLGVSCREIKQPVTYFKQFIDSNDYEQFKQRAAEVTLESPQFEITLPILGSKQHWFNFSGKGMFKTREKQPIHILGVIKDVTLEKGLSTELAEQKDFLEHIVENMPVGVFARSVRDDYNFVFWNKEMESITGISRAEVIGKNTVPGFSEKHMEENNRLNKNIMQSGERYEIYRTRRKTPFGERIENIYKQPLYDAQGEPFMLLGIGEDITKYVHLENRVHQAEKMEAMGQLTGGIAHDFNNQLMVIRGYAELLNMYLKHPKAQEYANYIVQATDNAAQLTSKLLAFARQNADLLTAVNVHMVIHDVINLLQRSIEKSVIIRHNLEAEHFTVCGEYAYLQNALLNLALNARDAMPEGGVITISTYNAVLSAKETTKLLLPLVPGPYFCLKVQDTGVGMTPEIMKQIFQPFFTTKPLGKGTGLGLSAVFGTVKAYKGSIHVESKLAEGTTFYLYFPYIKDDIKTLSTPSAENEKVELTATGTILLIDDEPSVLDLLVQALTEHEIEVNVCINGREGVEFYRTHWPEIDIVIMDMMMPELDGYKAFKRMQEINPEVKVIFLSGYVQNDYIEKIRAAGVTCILTKPIQLKQLYTNINKLLQ